MNIAEFFNLFCLVYGSFFVLYFIIKMVSRGGKISLYTVLLALLALTWGLYSMFGANL